MNIKVQEGNYMDELYYKFPSTLQEKLMRGDISFPENTRFKYDEIYVYRAIQREKEDFSCPDINDFRSYYELKKVPKNARGVKTDYEHDPHYYGVSSFKDKEQVRQIMHFPNPHKKMIAGFVYQEGGPQETKIETNHVCWWLYKDVDVGGFKIIEIERGNFNEL